MIITLEAEKDTYVTNRKTSISNNSLSNVGRAATIDLFKLINENSDVVSEGVIYIGGVLNDQTTITLIDSDNNTVIFKIDTSVNQDNLGSNNLDNIIVGTSGLTTPAELASHLKNVINSVNTYTQNGPSGNQTLNITAYNNDLGEVILRQNTSGSNGDTEITLSNSNNISKLNFRRIERSVGLIKFDIDEFKSKYINTLANSLFNDKNNYKVEVIFKDVSTGHTKPYNYTLRLNPITKSWDEGLGKDTVHFSDKDNANFINLNDSNNWTIPGYVSYTTNNDIDISFSYESTKLISQGNEDLIFDVTNWFHNIIGETKTDYGFVLDFSEDNIKDNNSYFVKRLGSRHLKNKFLSPYMKISMKDNQFLKNLDEDKKYYLNNAEDFYLTNKLNGVITDFSGSGYTLKSILEYNNNTSVKSRATLELTEIPADSSTIKLIDADGNEVIFEFDSSVDQNNPGKAKDSSDNIIVGTSGLNTTSSIALHLKNVINAVTEYVQLDDTSTGETVVYNNQKLNITATIDADDNTIINLIQDKSGSTGDTTITLSGTTNITASNFNRFSDIDMTLSPVYDLSGQEILGVKKSSITNTQISKFDYFLNTEIVEKGYATFNLIWKWVKANDDLLDEVVIKKQSIKFYVPDVTLNTINKVGNIKTCIVLPNKELFTDQIVEDLELLFYDSRKQYDVVKMPYDLPSENFGNGYYNIIDAESKEILLEGSEDYSALTWNGKAYTFSVFIPRFLKHKIINFEFVFKNKLYNLDKKLYNNDFKIRVS